jgi:hypothetical protein
MFTVPTPDLTSGRRVLLVGCLIAAAVTVIHVAMAKGALAPMRDTDDALRLVLVRELLSGKGWFHGELARLQPPVGLQMHWSRLIDGGLAAVYGIFALALRSELAEAAMAFAWPVLWIVPAAVAALAIARRLGGAPAVFVCALLLFLDQVLYLQFRPGRIDHHNVQIALTLVAVAGLIWIDSGRWGALAAGAATGLVLAVGLESLAILAIVAAIVAIRLAHDPSLADATQRYAAALGVTASAAYVTQTRPDRLMETACDGLAANLLAPVLVGTAGMALVAWCVRRGAVPSLWRRLGAVVGLGAAAAGLYVWIAPACVAGPFGGIDARLWPYWLSHVREIMSLRTAILQDGPEALAFVFGPALGLVGLTVALADPKRRRDPTWVAAGVLLVLAVALMCVVVRLAPYASWLGVPIVAGALTQALPERHRSRLVPALAAAMLASPILPLLLVQHAGPGSAAAGQGREAKEAESCFETQAYRELAQLPPGLVLNDIDLGPFILVHTPHSALAAPYHRMGYGIIAAHEALAASPDEAHARIQALGVAYVVLCRALAGNAVYAGLPSGSLRRQLEQGTPPVWLDPLQTDALRAYRVVP